MNEIKDTEDDVILKDPYSNTSSDLNKSNKNSKFNDNDDKINIKESK